MINLVKISNFGLLYFWRYALRKLGFLNVIEISLKQVNLVFLS